MVSYSVKLISLKYVGAGHAVVTTLSCFNSTIHFVPSQILMFFKGTKYNANLFTITVYSSSPR